MVRRRREAPRLPSVGKFHLRRRTDRSFRQPCPSLQPSQRTGRPPIGAAQQAHHARDDERPHDGGVDRNRNRDPDADRLDEDDIGEPKARKTAIMMAAAPVISRPLRSNPSATARVLSPEACQRSWMRASSKTS